MNSSSCSKMASAGKMIKFAPHLKEIRLHLCQKSEASKGAREFVEKFYVNLKKNNPHTPILVRECSGILPKIYARHELGKEVSASLENCKAEQVLQTLESLASKKL